MGDSSGSFRVMTFDGMFFKQIDSFEAHTDTIKAIKVIPEKKLIVTGCRDSGVKIWNMDDYMFLAHLTKHKDQVVSLDYHKDKPDRLVSGSWDQCVNVYDLNGLDKHKDIADRKIKEIESKNIEHMRESLNLKESWNNSKLKKGKMMIAGKWV